MEGGDDKYGNNKKEYTKNIVANLKDKISEFKNRKAHEKEERRNELDFEINKDLVNQFKRNRSGGNAGGMAGNEESKGGDVTPSKMGMTKAEIVKEMQGGEGLLQQEIAVLPKKSKTNTIGNSNIIEKDKELMSPSINHMKAMINHNEINKEGSDEKK